MKDSESGVEKMAIGHHIHDRGHVVEKKYNKKTGDKELNQNFHNMDECTSTCTWNVALGRSVRVSAPQFCVACWECCLTSSSPSTLS